MSEARRFAPRGGAGQRLRRARAVLREGWRIPACAVLVCGLVLAGLCALSPPRFRAVGLIELGLGPAHGRDLPAPPPLPPAGSTTHRRLLASRALADQARGARRVTDDGSAGPRRDFSPSPAERERDGERVQFLAGVEVALLPGTDLVEVHVVGPDPREVADRANAIMDAYLPFADRLLGSPRAQLEALREVEAALGARLAAGRARERALRAAAGGPSLEQQEAAVGACVQAVQVERTRLRIARAAAQAERARLERYADAGFPPTGPDSPVLAELRAHLAALAATLGATPDGGEVRADVAAELALLEARQRAHERVEAEARRARAETARTEVLERERALAQGEEEARALLPALEDEARRIDAQVERLDALRLELGPLEVDLRSVREEQRRLVTRGGPDGPVIVDRAEAPLEPEPRVSAGVAAALLASSAALGLLLLAARERVLRRVRCGADVARKGGPPLLGTIARADPRADLDLLRANLGAGKVGRKALVVTSSDERDPRAQLSLALASAMARAGERTLLVDADLVSGALSATFGVTGDAGLADVLALRHTLLSTVLPTSIPGLSLLPAGTRPATPDLLDHGRLAEVVEIALRHVDHVIVDAPPAGSRVEATLAALQADGVVHVVGLGTARPERVEDAVRQIEAGGGLNLGLVLVDPRAVQPVDDPA